MIQYFLGIDGGGTKTEAVILGANGQVVARAKAGGSNLHNLPVETCKKNILEAVNDAVDAAGIEKTVEFAAACAGMAGLDMAGELSPLKEMMSELISVPRLLVYNDGYIAFRSGSDKSEGVCLVASTGSGCYGIKSPTELIKAGDWGYLAGDQGSGFDLGKQILAAAVKEYDGRKADSGLLAMVLNHFGAANFEQLLSGVYADKSPVARIAGLAKLLSKPEAINHSELIEISQSSVQALADAFRAVIKKLNYVQGNRFDFVLSGKLFLCEELITLPLIEKIEGISSDCKIIRSTMTPAEAAARMAANL